MIFKLIKNKILTTYDLETKVSQHLTQPYSNVTDKQEVDDQEDTTSFDENKQYQTQPFQPNQLIYWLTYPNQQINNRNFVVQTKFIEGQIGRYKEIIFNIYYISFKFQEVNGKLDYPKGGYSVFLL